MKDDRQKNRQQNEERGDDALIEMLRPAFEHVQSQTTVLDLDRAGRLIFIYRALRKMMQGQDGVRVTYRMCEPLKTMGSVSIEGPEMEIGNTKAFGHLIQLASGLDIYPLANGNLRLTFAFRELTHPIE